MYHAIDYRRLTRGLAAVAVLLGVLTGTLAVAASSAFAQSATPDGPERVFALTTNDELLRFDGDEPRQATSMPITGLAPGDSLVGIDFRPSDGKLYGVADGTTTDKIYTIDRQTGVATLHSNLTEQLVGKRFGVDFNPFTDRLRIVSDADQNLRVNVDTGEVTVDDDVAYDANDRNAGENPRVTAIAYANNQPGFSPIELYDIDTKLDVLDTQGTQERPNSGKLFTVGPLGLDVKTITGFDIVTTIPDNQDRAFAALQPRSGESSAFYSVDLDTGQVTKIGRIGGPGTDVEGLAIPIGQP